ncbi:DMT family transporter [Roseospira visakhapatnamensis]|uniref:Drug/metabolite transporter (DMT)-like permease n=1 Tax=Roseospira visakhapatnamensis TaxID=390880 RepID=A0A7W6RCS7_9PROT|nr:DMT family transporter [Roseospira visakhapatnamensis]MBB4266154.1 drug/metabolite transporter (DMT)-like permease [Roseospira visakhapatnamensis]
MTDPAPNPGPGAPPAAVPHRAITDGDTGRSMDRPLAGIGFMLLAVALFSGMDTLAKALTPHFPVAQILLFRASGALLIVLPLAWRLGGGGRALIRTARGAALKLLLAGLLGAGALASFLVAWRTLSLIEVAAILFTAPLIVTALSVPLLREPVGLHRWSAVLVGFVGVLVILRPGGAVFGPAALWAMAGALCYALWMISLRVAGKAVPSTLVTAANALIMLAVALPLVAWVWIPPSPVQALGLVSIGVIGGLAQLCLTRAFSLAPAALVAPFDYSYILYGTALDLLVFSLLPTAGTWVGLILITAAGLYVIHRERVVAKRRRAAHA